MTSVDEKVVGPPPFVVKLLVAFSFIVVLVVGVVLVIFTVRNANLSAQTRDLVRAQQQTQARADCRSAYNSARQQVIERAAADAYDANLDFAGFLLGDPSTPQSKLIENRKILNAANAKVKALPTLDEMVDKGYRFDGEPAHPPCPVVK